MLLTTWLLSEHTIEETTSCFQLCLMQMCHHQCTSLSNSQQDYSVCINTHNLILLSVTPALDTIIRHYVFINIACNLIIEHIVKVHQILTCC